DPDALESIVNLGAVLLNRNRCAEALPYCERAVRELPADAATNSQLGKNYLCLGDTVRALQYFSAAKQIDPGHYSKPQLALAMIYMAMGADLLARAELDEALARSPDDSLAIDLKRKLAERTR
ncbi:MAG: tetratricopeptide repeat protein, partial [Bryobacteraceae bacterium]|nr:tetratricopeptide repeat protein [Bryobacteraceae bacterium]